MPDPAAMIADDGGTGTPADRTPAETASGEETATAWRDELSSRLSRYRSRRKAPPPRYPSLRLPFEAIRSPSRAVETSAMPVFESVSNQALALNEVALNEVEESPPVVEPVAAFSAVPAPKPFAPPVVRRIPPQASAKIIEFPRFAWGPPLPPPDQLAEPVMDRPRILEVPDIELQQPALGGITIEPMQVEEVEKRPGIDIPLQSAALGSRMIAAVVDGLIIAAASTLFGLIFWNVSAIHPPPLQSLALVGGIVCFFWAAYQYLLIVHGASTPGLRVAKLELTRFDGTATTRSLRRWRVLASCLSAVSLGMGYAWVFLDEDALCWHDRITHTYLAPAKRPS